jgi:GntR family transcriptional regulator
LNGVNEQNITKTSTINQFVSKSSPIPCYLQLKEILKQQIEERLFEVSFPSERELAEKYHLSRPTVRQALQELVKEGLILKRRGQISTVVPAIQMVRDYAQELISFSVEMKRKGYEPSSKVLRFETISAPIEIAEKLKINEGEDTIVLERVRYGDGEPFNLGISYLPLKLCPDILEIDFNQQSSLHSILKSRYGLDLVMSQESFEPMMPSKKEAQLLNITTRMPLLLMEGITYTADGIPVEYFLLKFRGDKARFSVRVFRRS